MVFVVMHVQANCLSDSNNNKDKFGWVKINIGEWFAIRLIRQSFPTRILCYTVY